VKTFRIVSLSLSGLAAVYCALSVPVWVHVYAPGRVWEGLGFPVAWILLVLPWAIFRKRLKVVSQRWWDQAVPVLSLLFVAVAIFVSLVNPKAARIEAVIAIENAKSLDFYGKVIDQFGNPVVGVNVDAGVGLYVSFTRSGGKNYITETDTTGRFSFVGIHGAGVGFTLKKEGYSYNQRLSSSSRPKDYVPDSSRPVIFTMWKLKGAEPMVHTSIQAGLACDGTPRSFDVLTGRRDTGDLIATLTRTPVNIDRGKPFDWTLTLGIAGGGLIEIADPYPYKAPAGGYQSSIAINMPADAKDWNSSVVRSYYIYDGRNYGRVTIDIMADYQPPPTHFEIDSYVNPSGSRNLEFDPAKQVR
jgi:hypothetical protein